MRPRKLGTIARLEDKLTKLVARLIKTRDRYTCQKCHRHLSEDEAQAAHVVAKSQGKILRWDPLNLVCLCDADHKWGHAHPKAFRDWFDWRFPDRAEYIESKRYQVCKLDETKLREMEALFEQELLRAESNLW